MKIAILSDLHLAPGRSMRCTASAEELLGLLEHLEEQADRVVVAGDLFDLDRPRVPGRWQAQLEGLRRQMPGVMRRLAGYDWVVGNHDAPLGRRNVPEERCFLVDGVRLLVRHGHQWDMGLKRLPGLAASANFVAGWLDRADWQGAARALGRAPLAFDALWQRRGAGTPGPDRCLAGARALLAEGAWDIVVAGHSHLLRLDASAHGLFVNTGSFTRGRLEWALVDTRPAGAPEIRASATIWRDYQPVQRAVWRPDGWEIKA